VSRRYAEPIDVKRIDVNAPVDVAPTSAAPAPEQFLWRGRLYSVRTVLAHWVEGRAWWRMRGPDGLPAVAEAAELEVWRVEAQAGRSRSSGVYDLGNDGGRWRLLGIQD
jgi:hypothetical protein